MPIETINEQMGSYDVVTITLIYVHIDVSHHRQPPDKTGAVLAQNRGLATRM